MNCCTHCMITPHQNIKWAFHTQKDQCYIFYIYRWARGRFHFEPIRLIVQSLTLGRCGWFNPQHVSWFEEVMFKFIFLTCYESKTTISLPCDNDKAFSGFASCDAPDRWQVEELEFPSFWKVLGILDRDISSVTSFTPHFSVICFDDPSQFTWKNQGVHVLRQLCIFSRARRSCCSSRGSCNIVSILNYREPAFVFRLSGKWLSISFYFQFWGQICFLKFPTLTNNMQVPQLTLQNHSDMQSCLCWYMLLRSLEQIVYIVPHMASQRH